MQKVKTDVNATVVSKDVEVKKEFEIIEETFDNLDFEPEGNGEFDEVIFVKMRTKDAHYFEFSKKVGDKIYKDPRTNIVTFGGEVQKMELGSYTYEQKEIKTLKIYIARKTEDGRTIFYILSLSFTQATRSIINSLLNCKEPIVKLTITLYKNQHGYVSVNLSINGKKAVWKYTIEQLKPFIETVTTKKGDFVSNDYSDLDEKFETELQNHLSILFPEQVHRRFTDELTEPNNPGEEDLEVDDSDADKFFDIKNQK